MTTYGIVSDFHNIDPGTVMRTLAILKDLGAEKLILNGDIAGERFCHTMKIIDEANYIAMVLNGAAKTGLETLVQPGSHEEVRHFHPVMQVMTTQYGNLHSAFEFPKIEMDDHHLVFLPGSDAMAGNTAGSGYALNRDPEHQTGMYRTKRGVMQLVNMEDLTKYVTAPERTIVICHVPPLFDAEKTVDRAVFGEVSRLAPPQAYQLHRMKPGDIMAGPDAEKLILQGAPVVIKRENRGNADLRDKFQELGVKKALCGHFHESAHHANDWAGKAVEEGRYVEELFWNAAYMDGLKAGILDVRGEKVKYKNVDLKEYL